MHRDAVGDAGDAVQEPGDRGGRVDERRMQMLHAIAHQQAEQTGRLQKTPDEIRIARREDAPKRRQVAGRKSSQRPEVVA